MKTLRASFFSLILVKLIKKTILHFFIAMLWPTKEVTVGLS